MEAVQVRGLAIAYERRGHGPALVMVHGGMADHREWDHQLDGLSDTYTTIAWDAPGCGRSSDAPQSFRMPEYAACLAAVVEVAAGGPAHVMGLSWGSTLALELYRTRPELVRSLLLTGAYAGWAGSLSSEEVRSRTDAFMAELERPPHEWIDRYLPTLLTARAPSELREHLLLVMRESRADGLRPMILAMAEADLRDVLPTISVPTLLLYGEEDVRSPAPVAEAMHAAIPDSTLVVLPEVGHESNLETPERFNAAVRDFLSRLG